MVGEKLPIAMLALLLFSDMFTRLTCLCYRLSFLPVTFLDLKNLKALWLCENQVSFDRVSRLLEINVLKCICLNFRVSLNTLPTLATLVRDFME